MRYLGFDCHKQVHTWALLNPDGGLAEEGAVLNAPRELRELRATFGHEVRVAFEGPRALRAALETVFADLPCYEVCAAWTHERRRHGRPKPKNDRHDARRVAKALYEESDQLVPLRPPHPERDALTIALQLYRRTAKDHRAAAQRFHELLTRLWQSASTRIFRDPLGATARRFFREYPHPHQAAAARKLGPRLREWSCGQMNLPDAQRIRGLARDFAPPTPAEALVADEMMELLDQLELLITKRRRLLQRLRDLVRELGCDWLLDQPGLGPLRAAELLDAGFLQSPGPNGFARLAGLAPVEFASGERSRHINAFVRRQHLFTTLMDWAQWLSMPRSGIPPARDYYARKRAEGKTRCTALRCLARQQINRLFRLRERHLSSSLNGVPPNEVKAG